MPSTAIEHFGYDEAARELHVTFVGGAAYTYYRVPKQVYAAFRAAVSKGKFLNARIKDRYDFCRHAKSA
jgi:lysyl-tRNA synthetase class 2